MKRIIAILLVVLTLFAFAGCSIGTNNAPKETQESKETDTSKIKASDYKKDFNSMVKYFVKKELVSGEQKTLAANIIGADKGVRYMLEGEDFVEFYQINTQATPDEAQELYNIVSNGKVYSVYNGASMLKGTVSSSGKYIMLYPDGSDYDYSTLIKEFKKF